MTESDDSENVMAWLESLDSSNYYQLLGLDPEANTHEIQRAFHRFSLSFHPDRHRERNDDFHAALVDIFKRGAEAYGVLRNEQSRAKYDLALAQGHLRLQTALTSMAATPADGLVAACKTPAGRLYATQLERALMNAEKEEAVRILDNLRSVESANPGLEGRLAFLWGRNL